MKIKGLVIAGLVFSIVGATLIVVGLTRDDFNVTPEIEVVELDNTANKIKYSGEFDDLEIVYGNVEKITINSKKTPYMTYEINQESDIIVINQNWSKEWYQFPISFTGEPFKITLPQDKEISLDLNMNAGNIEIKGIKGSDLNAIVDAGNISTEFITFTNCNIDINAGNIDIESSTVNNVVLTMDTGNVEYSGKILTKGDFSVDAGRIEVLLSQSKSEFTENSNGEVTGNGSIIINLDCDAGEIITRYGV